VSSAMHLIYLGNHLRAKLNLKKTYWRGFDESK